MNWEDETENCVTMNECDGDGHKGQIQLENEITLETMKHIKFRLVILLCTLIHSLSSYAYDALIDGIYYNLNNNDYTAEVTNPPSSGIYSGSISIPKEVSYNGKKYSVTSIRSLAFNECTGLTSLTIPNSVISIENYAINYCTALTSLTIPNSVTSIGNRAFYRCRNLNLISVDANNPKYDSRDNCNAIIEKSTNTLIAGCITTIIPNSVTSIGRDAFNGLSGLTSVTIPNSVTSIGNSAFAFCI